MTTVIDVNAIEWIESTNDNPSLPKKIQQIIRYVEQQDQTRYPRIAQVKYSPNECDDGRFYVVRIQRTGAPEGSFLQTIHICEAVILYFSERPKNGRYTTRLVGGNRPRFAKRGKKIHTYREAELAIDCL